MTHDPTRDCEHGRLKGKCDVCDLQAEVERLTELLNNPEEHYPGNFDTPQRANALLTGLCQDAANEIAKLQYEVDAIPAIKEERDALAAELTRLKASIALDKMADNARELGLDYEPAPVQEPVFCEYCGGNDDADFGLPTDHCTDCARPQPPAQPAPAQEPVGEVSGHDWSTGLLYRDLEPGTLLYATPQPVPVKTYHDGKPWPVAPKPWVGLTDEEVENFVATLWPLAEEPVRDRLRAIEAKLKEKNHDH
jgi:hypothetical protein